MLSGLSESARKLSRSIRGWSSWVRSRTNENALRVEVLPSGSISEAMSEWS